MKNIHAFFKRQFPLRARSTYHIKETGVTVETIIYYEKPLVSYADPYGYHQNYGLIKKITKDNKEILWFAVLAQEGVRGLQWCIKNNGDIVTTNDSWKISEKHRELVGCGNEGLPFSGEFQLVKWELF